MKQKLKILFAYFKSFKTQSLRTTILLDRHKIEDWDGKYMTDENKLITPVGSMEKIIQELIEVYYDIFRGYLTFEYDEYWHLYVNIYPNEQKIEFTASCKEETASSFERDYEYSNLDDGIQGNIDFLYSEFPDTAKIEFYGYGRWSDGEILHFYIDDRQVKITSDYDDALWNIANYFMTKMDGRFWNDEAGADFHIIIWGDDIFVNGETFTQEYEDTGMLIEVTPDKVEEFED